MKENKVREKKIEIQIQQKNIIDSGHVFKKSLLLQ